MKIVFFSWLEPGFNKRFFWTWIIYCTHKQCFHASLNFSKTIALWIIEVNDKNFENWTRKSLQHESEKEFTSNIGAPLVNVNVCYLWIKHETFLREWRSWRAPQSTDPLLERYSVPVLLQIIELQTFRLFIFPQRAFWMLEECTS